jgi:lipid II isoglutaminyl synthase (glutamine-hydrolysing)
MILGFQVFFFYILGHLLAFTSKLLKKGSGTSVTGLYVELWKPAILRFFNNKYKKVIFITGTNGKTTTRAVLLSLLAAKNLKVASNRGGANIIRGLASTLLMDLNIFLKPKSDYLVLEVEEASLPKIKSFIRCDYLILTNLFRDQLDAYGEIDKTLEYFEEFILEPKQSELKVLYNGDDGKLVLLVDSLLEKGQNQRKFIACGVDLKGTNTVFKYESDLIRPTNYSYLATKLEYSQGKLKFELDERQYSTLLPGIYNVYNLMFAVVVGNKMGFDNFEKDLSSITPVFGRGELFKVDNQDIFLFLVKNPAGFDLTLDHVAKAFNNSTVNLLFIVNDKIADSKDVSWLWDVGFEKANKLFVDNNLGIKEINTSGSRAMDILLRLEYAGFKVIEDGANQDIAGQVTKMLQANSNTTLVLATYTAMLDFRSEIAKFTNVTSITEGVS